MKSNIIAGSEAHTFCLFYILYRITQWGEGKSTSIMQSPAAYTLPVKLLTSTNDFLMIGPSIPQSCLLTNNHTHKHTHTHCTNSLPHTSIMSFIKGSTCGLMDHCECHSHWRYCIKIPTKGFFYLWHFFFFLSLETVCGAWILQMMMYLRCRKRCLLSKYSSFNSTMFQTNDGSLWISVNV